MNSPELPAIASGGPALYKRSVAAPSHWETSAPHLQHGNPIFNLGRRVSAFCGSVVTLARRKHDWTLPLLGHVLWCGSTNLLRQFEILRVLKQPAFEGVVHGEPKFPFRYLHRDYLAHGLAAAKRASSFLHHYKRLSASLSAGLLNQILRRGFTLHESEQGGNHYRIEMAMSRDIYWEGEMSLNLEVNGAVVFILSFSIVPGSVVGVESHDALLITRLQGVKGRHPEIHEATKNMHEIAPPALLVAALQGVAGALEIRNLAGICGTRQSAYCEGLSTSFKEAYDDFFSELGATLNSANFFLSSIPMQEKPLAFVTNGHKTRTRRKRAFKQQVANTVCWLLREDSHVASPRFESR